MPLLEPLKARYFMPTRSPQHKPDFQAYPVSLTHPLSASLRPLLKDALQNFKHFKVYILKDAILNIIYDNKVKNFITQIQPFDFYFRI